MAHAGLKAESCQQTFAAVSNYKTLGASYRKHFTFGSNPQNILNLVGTSNYSAQPISLFFRELIQNSVDAGRQQMALHAARKPRGFLSGLYNDMKAALHKSSQNRISVHSYRPEVNVFVDSRKNWLAVEDNGVGMNLSTIERAFLTLGGSEKGEFASGGFGIAKGALLYGSKRIFVSTVQGGKKHEFMIDSQRIRLDPKAKIEVVTSKARDLPNGTIVAIELPDESQPLPRTERDTELHNRPFLPDDIDVRFAHTNLGDSFENIRAAIARYKASPSAALKPFFKKTELNGSSVVKDKLVFESWGEAEIILSKTALPTGINQHHVLSHGIYQFTEPIEDSEFKVLPYRILIDLKPKVQANDPNYPFNLTRDGIRPGGKKDYQQIIDRIKKHVMRIRLEIEQQFMQDIVPLEKADLKAQFERFTSSRTHPKVFFDDEFNASDATEMSLEKDARAIDSAAKTPFLNNRTTMVFEGVENESMALFAKLAAVSEHIRDHLIQLSSTTRSYQLRSLGQRLKDFQVGILIAKGLHGVLLPGQFKMILFNPLILEKGADGHQIAENIYSSIVHEITHVLRSGHNELFVEAQDEIFKALAADGYNTTAQDVILEILLQHRATFVELRRRFQDESVVNTVNP